MKRRLKDFLKHVLLIVHKLLLKLRISVIPNHYYSPVPDINELAQSQAIWARESSLSGLQFSIDVQGRNLMEICKPFEEEYRGAPAYLRGVAEGWGPGFGYIEAQALHGFIRHFKPRQIIEVGSGVTTHCMLKALETNKIEGSRTGVITSIEPYPSAQLRRAPVKLIPQPVQTTSRDLFTALDDGDLLFIDSSHAVKTGSDVLFLILEVLPRLKPGVLVHFHDIFLPYDYRPDILHSFFDWEETSLLHAFLVHNEKVEILFCLSYLHHKAAYILRDVFPEYIPLPVPNGLIRQNEYLHFHDHLERKGHFPASFFFRIGK